MCDGKPKFSKEFARIPHVIIKSSIPLFSIFMNLYIVLHPFFPGAVIFGHYPAFWFSTRKFWSFEDYVICLKLESVKINFERMSCSPTKSRQQPKTRRCALKTADDLAGMLCSSIDRFWFCLKFPMYSWTML